MDGSAAVMTIFSPCSTGHRRSDPRSFSRTIIIIIVITPFVYPLINAVKELAAEIEAMKKGKH